MATTTLKLIALVLMFIDHIAEFIPGVPVWFHWLGRLSAPLFIFCMCWGFKYTHDRKKYVIRMYILSVFMALSNCILNTLYLGKAYFYIRNNIFSTLLLIAVIVWIIELGKADKAKGKKLWAIFILWQFVSTIICALSTLLVGVFPGIYNPISLFGAVTGNILMAEGSFMIVILGVLLYFNKEGKKSLSKAYIIYCVVCALISFFALKSAGYGFDALLTINYQWMMIFSLPFMLYYNGQKGRGLKYLFYVFYPAHIIILFLIGNAML